MAITGNPQTNTFGETWAHEEVKPTASAVDSASASVALAELDTATNSLYRLATLKKLEMDNEYQQKIPLQELRTKYPDIQWTEDKPKPVVDEIIKRHDYRASLENTIAYGPQNWKQSGINFLAGMVPHFVDPIELAAGYGVGRAVGAAASTRLGAAAARTGVMRTLVGSGVPIKSYTQVAASGFAEGFAGNLAAEIPTTLPAASAEQRQYTLNDAAYNAALGAATFTTLKVGGTRLMRFIRNKDGVTMNAVEGRAHDQSAKDQKVDVTPEVQNIVDRSNPVNPDYQHVPIADSTDLQTRKLFAAKIGNGDLSLDNAGHSDFFGSGTYLTDNEAAAKAAAAEHGGTVIEVQSKGGDYVNLESKTIDPRLNEALGEVAKELNLKVPEAVDVSGKDFINMLLEHNIDPSVHGPAAELILDSLGEKLAAKGVDGLHFVDSGFPGMEKSPRNIVVAFDQSKLAEGKKTQITPANPNELVGTTGKTLLEEAQNPTKKMRDYSADAHKTINDHIENPQVEQTQPREITNDLKNIMDDLTKEQADGTITPERKQLLETMKKDQADADVLDTVVKAATDCVRKNV